MLPYPEGVLVDAHHERRVGVSAWCRDDHPPGSGIEMRSRCVPAREDPGRLDDDVGPEITPREIRGVALRADSNAVAIDDEIVAIDLHVERKRAMRRVVPCQMCVRVSVTEIVDRHDLDLRLASTLIQGPEYVPTNAAVSVDRYVDRHGYFLFTAVDARHSRPRRS